MFLTTKRKLLKARIKLQQTIYSILEINRKRKVLSTIKAPAKQKEEIQTKLNILNKVAEQQAKLVKLYERSLKRKHKEQRDTA